MPYTDELKELISKTLLYLLREHSPKEWKFCDEEAFLFFKERAHKRAIAPARELPKLERVEKELPAAKELPKLERVEAVKELPKLERVEKEKPAARELPKMSEAAESGLSDIKKVLEAKFPSLVLLPNPPDDGEARKVNEKVLGEVVILCFDRQTPPFLKNLAFAIQQEIASCSIVSAARLESEKGWENLLRQKHLKLILSSDYGLSGFPGGMQYFREVPKQAKSFLGNIPLLLLTDLSLYLKEPKLKPTLWRAICQMLK
jgi:protein required for attachment to host cells